MSLQPSQCDFEANCPNLAWLVRASVLIRGLVNVSRYSSYVCTYIYTYIYIERERERYVSVSIIIYIYVCIYIYI